jgi:tetratricopeptide (TPR) repeat protein
MGLGRIRASRLALAIAVVVAALAAGGIGSWTRTGSRRAALSDAPAGASLAASPGAPGNLGNAFVDKTPPPEDPGSSPLDLRRYRYTTDQAIRLFQERAERNPRDFVSLAIVGEAHVLKARESGDPGEYQRAEEALRKSLERFPSYARAKSSLALVLCSRHKFLEGFELAGEVYDENPGNLTALATKGDAELELGRYTEAEATYRKLLSASTEPSTLARMARLAELKGQTDEALRLLRQAADAQRSADDPQGTSWYQVRLGDISFDCGRLDDAEAAYRAVLKEFPEHRDATAGLGKVCAARGRPGEAITLLTKAVADAGAAAAEPALLADLGDLYLTSGQGALAEQAFDRLEQTALRYPEYHRVLSLFYSDHDRQLPRALELAQAELAARRDIYGYDAMAWALYKVGRPEEAARAMAEALKLGTQDARLFYHAGLIDHRKGDTASARTWLGRALALNPYFSVRSAEHARRVLAALGGPSEARRESSPPR